MKKILLLLVFAVSFNFISSYGQDGAMLSEELNYEEYQDRLNLSEDQQKEIKAIQEKYKVDEDNLKQAKGMSRSEKASAYSDLLDKKNEEIAEVLTDEQEKELALIKEESMQESADRRAERKKRRGGGDRN